MHPFKNGVHWRMAWWFQFDVRKQLGDRALGDLCHVFDASDYSVWLSWDEWWIRLAASGLEQLWQAWLFWLLVLVAVGPTVWKLVVKCVRIIDSRWWTVINRREGICIYDIYPCPSCVWIRQPHVDYSVVRRCLLWCPNSYRTVLPGLHPNRRGGNGPSLWGRVVNCSAREWASDELPTVCPAVLFDGRSPYGESGLHLCLLKWPAQWMGCWFFWRDDRMTFVYSSWPGSLEGSLRPIRDCARWRRGKAWK